MTAILQSVPARLLRTTLEVDTASAPHGRIVHRVLVAAAMLVFLAAGMGLRLLILTYAFR